METVIVGCRLPSGLKLEVGYETVQDAGNGHAHVALTFTDKYRTYTLKGTNEDLKKPDGVGGIMLLPARLRPAAYINQHVPKDIWDEWSKKYATHWYMKSGNIFQVKDMPSAVAINRNLNTVDAPLAPVDPTKKFRVGDDEIVPADFHGKKGADREARE